MKIDGYSQNPWAGGDLQNLIVPWEASEGRLEKHAHGGLNRKPARD